METITIKDPTRKGFSGLNVNAHALQTNQGGQVSILQWFDDAMAILIKRFISSAVAKINKLHSNKLLELESLWLECN